MCCLDVTDPCLSRNVVSALRTHCLFLSFHLHECGTFPSSLNHVLEVYSFDSIALHMDGLNQIPQTQ